MIQTVGYAAKAANKPLEQFTFERRDLQVRDILVDILYCGICHSDIHEARNEWLRTVYPIVPGHEIIGRVAAVGAQVTMHKVGDIVGVGTMVDSCGTCAECQKGLEQYCLKGSIMTFNSPDPYSGGVTYGGYSKQIVTPEQFVLRIPQALHSNLPAVAPLLCAGITMYSPLRHWNIGPQQRVAIAGVGGLGHLAIKFAHAFGADVVGFTTTGSKLADMQRLGAQRGVLVTDMTQFQKEFNQFDFVLSSIPAPFDISPYIELLAVDGTLCQVGIPNKPLEVGVHQLITKRRQLAGSLIGGIAETQEMFDFCAKKGIVADVEVISMKDINTAFDRVVNKEVRYRYVIDMSSL